MSKVRRLLDDRAPQSRPVFSSIYCVSEAAENVDFYGHLLPLPHWFEWNLFSGMYAHALAVDLNVMFSQQYSGCDRDLAEFVAFLERVRPAVTPHLVETMAPGRDKGDIGKFKARVYREAECELFVEHDEQHAATVFELTMKRVLCTSTGRLLEIG